MKKATVLLIITVVLISSLKAAIPTTDLSAMAQRIALKAQEIAKWTIYIDKFRKYTKTMQNLKSNFERTAIGIPEAELNKLIGDNIERTGKIIDSIAYTDKDKKDVWTEIFKDYKRLGSVYQNIDNTDHLQESYLNVNPNIRQMINETITARQEALQDIQKQISDLGLIREIELEVMEKISHYEDQVKELGSADYPSYAKVTTLLNLMDLDILVLTTNQLALYRIMLEKEIKSMTIELDNTQKMLKQQLDETKNIQLLNQE